MVDDKNLHILFYVSYKYMQKYIIYLPNDTDMPQHYIKSTINMIVAFLLLLYLWNKSVKKDVIWPTTKIWIYIPVSTMTKLLN